MNTVVDHMERCITLVKNWCRKVNERLNPITTTLIPTKRKRIISNLNSSKLCGETMLSVIKLKYLRLVLNAKLT